MAIYLVQTQSGDTLVDAKSKAQAISHIIKPLVTAKAVSAGEVVALMQKGVKVETAIEEPDPSNITATEVLRRQKGTAKAAE